MRDLNRKIHQNEKWLFEKQLLKAKICFKSTAERPLAQSLINTAFSSYPLSVTRFKLLFLTLFSSIMFIVVVKVEVLDWSGQPYGSAWVHRQAMQYLLEVSTKH